MPCPRLAWTVDFDEQRLSQVIARDVALLGEIGAQSVISDALRAGDVGVATPQMKH